MGGSPVSLITSVIGLMSGMQKPEGPPDNSAQLEAERKAREEEKRQEEAKERKLKREKVTEARTLESKRLAAKPGRKTTLAQGGAGLIDDPAAAKPTLKTKLGE